jgi:secondary thiamine-phosphate synthase enzyme
MKLSARSRGFHLITTDIEREMRELPDFEVGMAHVFICHTSASLTLNENTDPDVRTDFESHFNRAVPENAPYYVHTLEGADDMPAHIKASVLGSDITVPITNGRFNLGVWQGIYLCEHRDRAMGRDLVITMWGKEGEAS